MYKLKKMTKFHRNHRTNLWVRCKSHRSSTLSCWLRLFRAHLCILCFALHSMAVHLFCSNCKLYFVGHWFHFQDRHVTSFSSWQSLHVIPLHEQEMVFPPKVPSKVPLLAIQYKMSYKFCIQMMKAENEFIKILKFRWLLKIADEDMKKLFVKKQTALKDVWIWIKKIKSYPEILLGPE